jgi:hypothetical protein
MNFSRRTPKPLTDRRICPSIHRSIAAPPPAQLIDIADLYLAMASCPVYDTDKTPLPHIFRERTVDSQQLTISIKIQSEVSGSASIYMTNRNFMHKNLLDISGIFFNNIKTFPFVWKFQSSRKACERI